MNPVVALMLVFATLGLFDKMIGGRLGLADSFDSGLSTMPTQMVCVVGTCTVGLTFLQNHMGQIEQLTQDLPFNTGIFIGALLAPDLGAISICRALSSNTVVATLNGVILAGVLGQTLSFQLPVFLSGTKKEYRPVLMNGFIVGFITVPTGFILAALLLKASLGAFLSETLPIVAICALIAAGLHESPAITVRIFQGIAYVIQTLIFLLFFLAMAEGFFAAFRYADFSLIKDTSFTVVKTTVIVCGSVVLSHLIRKTMGSPIRKAAVRLGVNEISVICLILNCATSLAILPFFGQMDRKGQLINCAFAVSAAYVVGGQFGYTASMTDSYTVTVYILAKLFCGAAAVFLAAKLSPKLLGAAPETQE